MADNVYGGRVSDLSHPQWQFKVDMNAQENHLTGCALLWRHTNVVVVEGGPKAIKRYTRLLLHRIQWGDKPVTRGPPTDPTTAATTDDDTAMAVDAAAAPAVPHAGPNQCHLVWRGETKKRAFKLFTLKQCATEVDAKQFLRRFHVEHYWQYAKDFVAM